MPDLTLENIGVLLILTVLILVIVFFFVFCFQKIFKTLFSLLNPHPTVKQSAFQNFDFRDSFYDHDVTNEAFPSNYQTINIYSSNTNHNQAAPSINISLKSINRLKTNGEESEKSFLEKKTDENLERLTSYANNFCRSCYNLKWKNQNIKKIGSRNEKISFFITQKQKEDNLPVLFSFVPLKHCKLKMDEAVIKNGVKNICENIKHPNIQNLIKFDIEHNLELAIIIKPLENCSVKDLIYGNKDCKLSFHKKYEIKNIGKPLDLTLISKIGCQVLLGLHYLHSMNFYHNNIHSGNIYIRNNKVLIGELENYILNLPSKNRKIYEKILFNKKFSSDRFECAQEIIDIIQFGQLLYEMVTGCELKMLQPDPNDYIFIPSPIARILKEIFPENDNLDDKSRMSLNLKSILDNTSNISDTYFSQIKMKKGTYLKPKIKIEEMLYDEFFRDESDPFYKSFMNLPKFQDQISKGIIKQLNKLNYNK